MGISRAICVVRRLLGESLVLFWGLVKLMVPVMVIVRLATEAGLIEAIAPVFSPFMAMLGLPAAMGLVWITGVLVGKWAAAGVFVTLLPATDLTVAQASVLWATLLIAHAIPLEQVIVRKAGASFLVTSALRVGGGFLYGALLHLVYGAADWLQQPLSLAWLPEMSAVQGWGRWTLNLGESLTVLFAVLFALVVLLQVLEYVRLTDWLARLTAPLMRPMGIEPQATPMIVVGILMGLAYGGGLIVREAQSGRLSGRTVFLSLVLLGFFHGMIEDTAIAMTFGCHYSAAIIGRIVFSLAAMFMISRLILACPEQIFARFFFSGDGPPAR